MMEKADQNQHFPQNTEQGMCLRAGGKVGYSYTGIHHSTPANKDRLLDRFPLSLDATWSHQKPTPSYVITGSWSL